MAIKNFRRKLCRRCKKRLKKLLSKTLALRDFDYLRQVLVFNYVYKNSDYFKNIKYLILDDGDEITPVCFDFISYLAPQLNDVFIAFDEKGASRTGYLSADRTAVWKFEELFNQNAEKLHPKIVLQKMPKLYFQILRKTKPILLRIFHCSHLPKELQ